MTISSSTALPAPRQRARSGPLALLITLWVNRGLIYRLTRREIELRYKGSVLGLVWSFLVPLMMLGAYTFVFSTVFHQEWPIGGPGKRPPFYLIAFAGIICLTLFQDCVSRAPLLIVGNVSYVRKVVFPLEVLPVVILLAELFNALIGTIVLAGLYVGVLGRPPAIVLLLPVVVLPLAVLIVGLVWFISSLGVFLRDLRQLVGVILSVVPLISPLFYPMEAVPGRIRLLLYLNPLTVVLEQVRDVLFKNAMPNWWIWGAYMVGSSAVALAGFAWFKHAQRGFADVL